MNSSIATALVISITILLSCFPVAAEKKPLTVGTAKLSTLLINQKHTAPAFIVSLNHTTISSEITGRVLKVLVKTGDYVKKGDKLATIDCRSYTLAKKQAEAGLKVAKTQLNYSEKQFKRNQRLLKSGIIPKENFEKAESSRLTALADIQLKKAAIDTTKLAISRCTIYAPYTGQITQKLIQKGQLVTAGTPLYKIIENNTHEVKANLSPEDIKKLDNVSSFYFVTEGEQLKIIVRSIIQNIDETTRTQEVRFALETKSDLPAGLAGRVEWTDQQRLLPAEYLIRRNSILGIMLAKDIIEGIGNATFYQLIGAKEGLLTKVNLPEDTLVITQNRHNVKHGQKIKVQ